MADEHHHQAIGDEPAATNGSAGAPIDPTVTISGDAGNPVIADPVVDHRAAHAFPRRTTHASKRHSASVYPNGDAPPLPSEFADLIIRLEQQLEMPVWMLVQNGRGAWSEIGYHVFKGFQQHRDQLAPDGRAALIIESPGGDAHFAYRIARLFQRRTNEFVVIVPQYAKSAATLLALGASTLILGNDAELGPLDVQMLDREREDFGSALDAVQALERLNVFAMTAVDQSMGLLLGRTGKKIDSLLPHVLLYATNFVRPLLENIDTVDYTKKSRELKVAEEYAARLMQPNYRDSLAKHIARKLVQNYPTHGFAIDPDEAATDDDEKAENFGLDLRTFKPPDDVQATIEALERLTKFAIQ